MPRLCHPWRFDLLRVLIELRPAFDGHAGIPQETRLLFRGLTGLKDLEVLGLLQSSNLVVDPGLDLQAGEMPRAAVDAAGAIDHLSRVVVSLQQGAAAHRFEYLRKVGLKIAGPLGAAFGALWGRHVRLTGFDATHFTDFIWRSLYAKSLPVADFDAVTRAEYRVIRWPWSLMNALGVGTSWLGHAVYPRLDTTGIDVMIAETPYPGRVRRGTSLVVRYHDAIPLLMPHTIKDRGYHRAMHFHALRRNAADGAWFACVSEATRKDLLSVLPALEGRTVTIPNMVSHHFMQEEEPATRVSEIVWSRKNRNAPNGGGADITPQADGSRGWRYLLMVSTVEPRKNHQALLDAWELLRSGGHPDLNLVCVGSLGWEHESILRRLTPWLHRGGLHLLEGVPAPDLRLLYRHAEVTVCPSLGEGFDFAGVEAMRSGGVVAASDIAVHREVFSDAADYFSAYDAADMAAAISRLLGRGAEGRRAVLRARGTEVASRYTAEQVMPLWEAFLRRLKAAEHRI